MFTGLRKRFGNYILRRESATLIRQRKMCTLKNSRTVGILYTLSVVLDYEQVCDFVSSLQKEHKVVHALGFVQDKDLIYRFLPKLSYDFFSPQDLKWYFKPVGEKVSDFTKKEFDLLIDLSIEEYLPLKFIAGLSLAHCKVGKFHAEDARFYDLMISVPPGMSLKEFISQVLHYLTIIQTKDA